MIRLLTYQRKFKHLEEGYLPKSIVSFGGHQSNALYALAKLVHYKNCEIGRDCQLTYVCKVLPRWLKANPTGNFKEALNRGTKFVELETEDFNILTQLESEQALTFLNLPLNSAFIGLLFSMNFNFLSVKK